ncbi:MAG: transglutaminase-like domain-containing protein [Candidatus Hydrogenedentes bacterium]|nr:transglutaminase-like domain-containing protein [Candidatus Hydrogenedentota bacterium]
MNALNVDRIGKVACVAAACWLPAIISAQEVSRYITDEIHAASKYDNAQSLDVMRSEEDRGVVLSDLALIENDAPGAGLSEKGSYLEPIHAGVWARKTFLLDDPRALAAHVVLYMEPRTPGKSAPYHLLVNGHRVEGIPVPWHEGVWHWVPVPVDYLVQGENTIVIVCDASPEEGYNLMFARADEYDRGGGPYVCGGNTSRIASRQLVIDPDHLPEGVERIEVGRTSAKSTDGGHTWSDGLLGPGGDVSGEYTIRLSLQRYRTEGALLMPPIDLWNSLDQPEAILPPCRIDALRLMARGATPENTRIEVAARFADSPEPADASSPDFRVLGTLAPGQQWKLDELAPDSRRYMQVRARLLSASPLVTPVFTGIQLQRRILRAAVPRDTFYVRDAENPRISYSSYWHAFERADLPELKALRERLDLDNVIEGAATDFERINRVRHHVSQLWFHKLPYPEYPEWNAHAVLDRNEKYGWGGMCMQFVVVFMQAMQSLGYQARHVNLFNHESVEVYVDELGKWVLVDPESVFDSYEFDTRSGEPLNAVEQHRYFLKRYGFSSVRPIPWMSPEPWCNWPTQSVFEWPQPLEISTSTGWINDPDPVKRPPQHNLAGFVRVIPRNDFLTHPTPRPLNNGSTFWPWNGYVCWYDKATPRQLQYAMHSDRVADFYPTLNRVAFSAVHGETLGDVKIDMTTQTPNFVGYEVNIDDGGWKESPSSFTWTLWRNAINRLEMRVRNKMGVRGKPSSLVVFWHYREPYQPAPETH